VKKTEPHYTLISSFMQALIKRQSFLRLFAAPLLFAPVDANEMLKSARLHICKIRHTPQARDALFASGHAELLTFAPRLNCKLEWLQTTL
jgi:hypothetical protein